MLNRIEQNSYQAVLRWWLYLRDISVGFKLWAVRLRHGCPCHWAVMWMVVVCVTSASGSNCEQSMGVKLVTLVTGLSCGWWSGCTCVTFMSESNCEQCMEVKLVTLVTGLPRCWWSGCTCVTFMSVELRVVYGVKWVTVMVVASLHDLALGVNCE